MRIRLLLADIFTVLLGLYGYLATYSLMAFDCNCRGMNYIGAIILFVPASVFLLPSAQKTILQWSFSWLARVPLFLVAVAWSFFCAVMLRALQDLPILFPHWSTLSEHALEIWLLTLVMLVFNYLLPGAAYAPLRHAKKRADDGQHNCRPTNIPNTGRELSTSSDPQSKKTRQKYNFAPDKLMGVSIVVMMLPVALFVLGLFHAPAIPSVAYQKLFQDHGMYLFVGSMVFSIFLVLRTPILDQDDQPARPPNTWYLLRMPYALFIGLLVWFASYSAIPVAANLLSGGTKAEATYTIKDITYDNRCRHLIDLYISEERSFLGTHRFCLNDDALAARLSHGDRLQIIGEKTWFGHSIERIRKAPS